MARDRYGVVQEPVHRRRRGTIGVGARSSAGATGAQLSASGPGQARRGRKYPAAEIVQLYHERWEIELGNGEIKTELLCREETLRSKKPALVRQEVWGILLAYNGVRLEMDRLAREFRFEPTRLSFVMCLHAIQAEWLVCCSASPGAIPRHLARLRSDLVRCILPPRRRERSYPRAVKIAMNHFPRKRATPVPR